MEPETICFLSTECFRPVMMTHPNFFTFWPSLAAIIWNKRTLFHSCRYRVLDLPLRTHVKTCWASIFRLHVICSHSVFLCTCKIPNVALNVLK